MTFLHMRVKICSKYGKFNLFSRQIHLKYSETLFKTLVTRSCIHIVYFWKIPHFWKKCADVSKTKVWRQALLSTQFRDNNFYEILWRGCIRPTGLRSPKTPRLDMVKTFFIVVIGILFPCDSLKNNYSFAQNSDTLIRQRFIRLRHKLDQH